MKLQRTDHRPGRRTARRGAGGGAKPPRGGDAGKPRGRRPKPKAAAKPAPTLAPTARDAEGQAPAVGRRAGGPPRSEGGTSLRRQYQALLRAHERLVEKLASRTVERTALFQLAWWSLQTSPAGLALISDKGIVASNPMWKQLQGRGENVWAVADAKSPGRPRSLREAALAVGAALLASDEGVRGVVLERTDRREVVELRLERAPSPEGARVVARAWNITSAVLAEETATQALRQLRHRERMVSLGQLVSGVGHDLTATLGAMRLRLEELRADPELVLRHARSLEALDQIVADASARVKRLRDFVRRDPAVAQEETSLEDVVAGAVELVRTELARGGAPVRIHVELPELPPVKGSAAELRHLIINLLMNARDAMPEGGQIALRAAVRPSQVLLRVEDEGRGIPPEHLPHLFEPFFTTKGKKGTGLGLSMARELMLRLGGSISADNRAGGGAVFTLVFPRRAAPQAS